MNKPLAAIILLTLILSGCGTKTTISTKESITLEGTIIENPSHLTNQSSFLLVNTENNTLLAYLSSNEITLNNFIDQSGILSGTKQQHESNEIPEVLVSSFTPPEALSLEDILFSTIKREAKKDPYNRNWQKNGAMIVMQSDNTNGSAQVQVTDNNKVAIVRMVKNQDGWHIAEIESKGYSAIESSPISGSGASAR